MNRRRLCSLGPGRNNAVNPTLYDRRGAVMPSTTANFFRRFSAVLVASTFMLVPTGDAQVNDRRTQRSLRLYQKQHEEHRRKLADALAPVVQDLKELGYDETAAEVELLAEPPDANLLDVQELPRFTQPEISNSLPPEQRRWRVALRHAQTEYAKNLYLLSRRALGARLPSYAYRLVRETARHDSDHAAARRLLGYVRVPSRDAGEDRQEWISPFAADMRRRGYVRHKRFGWLPQDHVERYDNGERYYKGRWISEAQESEYRRDFDNAWRIRTEHFLIVTNHSHEKGVEIANALEEFYDVFTPTFAAFFTTPEQMRKLFEGGAAASRSKPHLVHYYRTRAEYDSRLIEKIPEIKITNGLYYTNDRTSYFYHNDGVLPTIYHEASHQLFYESSTRDRPVGRDRHFWIIEAIACYMESFKRSNGRATLGDPRFVRFHAARHRYLEDDYYIPLLQFDAMSMRQFQHHPNVSRNYSQASGLAHFLMHYEDGRYREPLIEHLSQLYNSSGPRRSRRVESLPELIGVDYATLDRQYGEYIQKTQDKLDEQRSNAPAS